MSVDISGRTEEAGYDSQSLLYHYPNLAPIEFFDRAEFPGSTSHRGRDGRRFGTSFSRSLRAEEGFTPYISYPPGCRSISSRS